MRYTSHGLMYESDLAEMRADYDMDLCPDCEDPERETPCPEHGELDDEDEAQ